MPTGRPDWYDQVVIVGSDVVVPISIQGVTVTLDVNIVGQDVTIDVNITNPQINVQITGSSVTLDVNIASSSVTLDVNIVGSVTINVNISGVDSGVVFNVQITGSSVTLDVNIASSSVTLDINIKSPLTDEGYVKSSIEKSITLNVSIQSQAVTLDVNIASQSVDIGVVIKSSEVTFDVNVINSELNVNVGTFPFEKASENILENPGFETGDLSGWYVYGNASVQSSVVWKGSYAVELWNTDGGRSYIQTTKNYSCQPGQKILVTGAYRHDANVERMTVRITLFSSEVKFIGDLIYELDVTTPDTWHIFKYIFEIPDGVAYFKLTVDVYAKAGVTGYAYYDSLFIPRIVLIGHSTEIPVNMNIASQSVDLDVNVKAQEVTLNVKVEGTASVSIDNATVVLGMKHEERRGEYWTIGDYEPVDGWEPLDVLKGKLFPQGMRGYYQNLYVKAYNSDSADHTLTIYFCIDPYSPPILTITKTITAGFQGTLSIGKFIFWNYDSMFIYFEADSSDIQIGYKSATQDTYWYDSSTEKWKGIINKTFLVWLEALGKSKSEFPVSGTVNTINIPNIGTGYDVGDTEIPGYSEYELVSIQGMGKLLWATVYSNYAYALVRIYADGSKAFEYAFSGLHSHGFENANFGVQLIQYDTSTNKYRMIIGIPIPFKRELKIAVYNGQSTSIYASAKVIAEVIS